MSLSDKCWTPTSGTNRSGEQCYLVFKAARSVRRSGAGQSFGYRNAGCDFCFLDVVRATAEGFLIGCSDEYSSTCSTGNKRLASPSSASNNSNNRCPRDLSCSGAWRRFVVLTGFPPGLLRRSALLIGFDRDNQKSPWDDFSRSIHSRT